MNWISEPYRSLLPPLLAGWGWLFICKHIPDALGGVVCPFRALSGIPCPCCGVTGGILALLEGHLAEAIRHNPLSAPILSCLILLPLWFLYDLLMKRPSFTRCYHQAEKRMRHPLVLASLILCGTALWVWRIWNIV